MTIQESLTKELVNYILSIFGLVKPVLIGTLGICQKEYKTYTNIKIEYENSDLENFPIYSAFCTLGSSKLHVLAVCTTCNDFYEFSSVFRLDENIIYGLKSDSEGYHIFLVSKDQKNWSKINLHDKLVITAALEFINDSVVSWNFEPDIKFLYKYLVEIVEM
jgi:hypothetical protein